MVFLILINRRVTFRNFLRSVFHYCSDKSISLFFHFFFSSGVADNILGWYSCACCHTKDPHGYGPGNHYQLTAAAIEAAAAAADVADYAKGVTLAQALSCFVDGVECESTFSTTLDSREASMKLKLEYFPCI